MQDTLDTHTTQLAAIANQTSITTAHQFVDNAARDTYFTAQPTELVAGLYISVGTGFQQYLSGAWVAKSAVVTVLSDVLTDENQAWGV